MLSFAANKPIPYLEHCLAVAKADFWGLLPFPLGSRPLHCSSSGEHQLPLCAATVPSVPSPAHPGHCSRSMDGMEGLGWNSVELLQKLLSSEIFEELGCSGVAGTRSQIINAYHWWVRLLGMLSLPGVLGNLGFFSVCKDCLEGEMSRGFCAHTACSEGVCSWGSGSLHYCLSQASLYSRFFLLLWWDTPKTLWLVRDRFSQFQTAYPVIVGKATAPFQSSIEF